MKRLCFLISHKPDNRYIKRINILKEKYDLRVIFWNKNINGAVLSLNGVTINEIQIPANQTNPLKRIPELLRFIKSAYKKLIESNPDAIYVGNLDMLYIANRYRTKKNKNVKIIYEIADLHRLIIDKQVGFKWIVSKILKVSEKEFCKSIDILVLTSMKFFDIYYSKFLDKNKVVFLPNMPELDSFKNFLKTSHDTFTVGFIGWIRYKNQLRLLIQAAQEAKVKVLFAGEDGEGNDFENECQKYEHVTYLGPFDYDSQIVSMYQKIDCVYAVYDADMANVRVALPNKLYEAILCEKPIIVAKNTYLSELVLNMRIGAAVSHKNKKDLTDELIKMSKDKQYYEQLCNNCYTNKDKINLENFNNELLKKIDEILN